MNPFIHRITVGLGSILLVFLFPVCSTSQAAEPSADLVTENPFKELLAGPATPEAQPTWLANLRRYRQETRSVLKEALGNLPDPYDDPALQWTRRSFIQPQMMMHDRYFFDPVTRKYTVDRYLADLRARYGGIDSVLIWPTYPNIGVDDRNQFDLWSDLPGGLPALREAIAEFHRQGVHVLIPIMAWDHGTRDAGQPMPRALVELAKTIGADGLNGDTMNPVPREYHEEAVRARHPLSLEPENGLGDPIDALAWNTNGWAYWWPYQDKPGVSRYKFLEPRHLPHVCDRYVHDRSNPLQYAFFNGVGYESWENVWGMWNWITPRDAEALRRISAIYRAMPPDVLINPNYEPYAAVLNPGIFATRFPGKDVTLWTFINRTEQASDGQQINVGDVAMGTHFYDLWKGTELQPTLEKGKATLSFTIEAHGYGAVLASRQSLPAPLRDLLLEQKKRASIRLASLSADWTVLPQQMIKILPTTPVGTAPKDMVKIPGGHFHFVSTSIMVEKYEGSGVQYPWETAPQLKHEHDLDLPAFYIDLHPVTCAEYQRFLIATRYKPVDDHNFLKGWKDGKFSAGWEKKPVTWVSLEDARAYATWAGKRLPHEWEWQYAAQGTDGRPHPWGSDPEAGHVPDLGKERTAGPPADVDAHPTGASPFGVLDLVGNVWQWTDEYYDDHTRAAILKGGSSHYPQTSEWYFPQARELEQQGKYLLLSPSIDRSALIGFRCVADATP